MKKDTKENLLYLGLATLRAFAIVIMLLGFALLMHNFLTYNNCVYWEEKGFDTSAKYGFDSKCLVYNKFGVVMDSRLISSSNDVDYFNNLNEVN